jgi:branched-chain amino acid transport system permease protein
MSRRLDGGDRSSGAGFAGSGAKLRRVRALEELLGPAALVVAAALLGVAVSASTQTYFTNALVEVAIVVALYVFIGNSGVLSFGHVSFVAVGAWTAGVLSVPASEKPAIMPGLAHFLRDRTVDNVESLALAALVGGVCALVVALPLMRLSGLAAGIATFAVLEIVHNLLRYEERIGPGLNTFSSVPETTGLRQAALGALVAIVVAFVYARSRYGRLLRATREDPAASRAVGISVYRQRLIAFALSGLLAGLAGGLYVHLVPLNTEALYLDLTFITLAMLVVGGATSLWGAVVGALGVSALDSVLAVAENGTSFLGAHVDLPAGTRLVAEGVLMAFVLIVRPGGLTGGREFRLPRRSPGVRMEQVSRTESL